MIYIILVIYIIYIKAKFCQEIRDKTSLKNTVFIKISYTLFSRGNRGNKGNSALKPLVLQKSYVPTLPRFCSPCSPFPMCRSKLTVLFYNVFFENYPVLTDFLACCCFSMSYFKINYLASSATDGSQNEAVYCRQEFYELI